MIDFRSWLYRDRNGALSCAVLFSGLWLISTACETLRVLFGSRVDVALGLIALLVGVAVSIQAEKQRGQITVFVINLTKMP